MSGATGAMHQTIWKFPLRDGARITIPAGWQRLDVQVQQGTPCLWAVVDPRMPEVTYEVRQYGTGHPVENFAPEYVGTTQSGPFVWHWFLSQKEQADADR